MKTGRLTILITVVLLVGVLLGGGGRPAPSLAQEARTAPRLITVTGEAEVKVVPDEVILTLGVETWDTDLERAKKKNDDAAKKIMAAATSNGVAAQHVQTDYMEIEPRYSDNYEKRDFVGYFARKTIVVTVKDIAKFEDVLSAALSAGANYVHGVQFRTTQLRKHRDDARILAIRAAKEKATAMAKELGQTIGDPQTIQEDQNQWWSGYGAWWGSRWGGTMTQNVVQNAAGAGAPDMDSALAPGQISVTARVTVSFEMKR
jgi:uncharacterized protein YggE